MQRKIKSSKINFENQKENTSGSDLESLLVSSIRYDNQSSMPNASQSLGPESKYKPSQNHQSLIKKQYVSNVYIEQSCESKCQFCQKKIDAIHQSLTLINLKLQQFESKINICFGKYGKTQTKLGQIQLLMEKFQHCQQDNCEKIKELSSNTIKIEQDNALKLREYSQELNRMKKIAYRLQGKDNDKICLQSKRIEHKLEKFKDQQQFKLKDIIETLQKVGNLQRKIIDGGGGQKIDQCTMFLNQEPIKKKYFRTYSICEKNRTNQSTNISYSRNYEFPK